MKPTCAVSFPTCAACGVVFAARKGGVGKKRTTCTLECRAVWADALARQRDHGTQVVDADRLRAALDRAAARKTASLTGGPPACARCGETLPPAKGTKPRKWCSASCRVAVQRKPPVQVVCAVRFPECCICGNAFVGRPGGQRSGGRLTCSELCRLERNARRQSEKHANLTADQRERRKERKHQRRAKEYGVEAEQFKSREVFERDGWVCGICEEPVDPDLLYPNRMCASLDHIIPLSLGGAHTRENTRCSHLHCNIARSNRVEVAA